LPKSASRQNKKRSPAFAGLHFWSEINYRDFFPAALTLAQRIFAIADSLALAAALMVRFFVGALVAGFAALIFAHRAFCAAATLARPAALMPPFFFGALAATGTAAPRI
jgi:hypothetical protein